MNRATSRPRAKLFVHAGSVVIVPRLPDGRLILVRQYRHAVKETLWELVAGGMEQGETPRQSARRELLEETGYRARVLKPLLEFYPSPGILSEKMHLVEAWDLTPSKGQPDADERIEVGFFTVSQVMKMIRSNEIRDGENTGGNSFALRRRIGLTMMIFCRFRPPLSDGFRQQFS